MMTASDGPDIVVGVDGSRPSVDALIWALRLAAARDWSIEVVTAWPGAGEVLVHEVPGHFSVPRERACEAQESALAEARRALGDRAPVEQVIVNAHPVEALRDRAVDARLLVVGGHSEPRPPQHAGRAAVGDTLAMLVDCPLVVVQEHAPERELATT